MRETPTTVLGVMHLELHIPMCRSLKEKRGALRPCLCHIRGKFNVAVAEVADLDTRDWTVVAVTTVANDRTCVQNRLREVEEYLLRQPNLELHDVAVEIL